MEEDSMFTIFVPEMYAMEDHGAAPVPGFANYVPVPPGSELHLEWAVGAVGNTGWDRTMIMSSSPILSGRGLQTVSSFQAVEFPSAHDPVSYEVIHLLGTTVIRITISPFCYGTPASYAREINYSLSFQEPSGGRSTDGTLLQSLCPGLETWWPYRQRSLESFFWGKPWARIKVGNGNTGFYSVSCEELEASGCAVTGVPSVSLAMFSGPGAMFDYDNPGDQHQLAPVSVKVFDGGDGIFGPADSLIFFGQGLWHWNFSSDSLFRSYHRYDENNTYWLTWGGDNGARIDQVTAIPSGGQEIDEGVIPLGFEEEIFWEFVEDRTGWVWTFLNGEFPSYFYLSSPFASDLGTVRLSVINETASYHRVWAELEGDLFLDTVDTGKVQVFSVDSVPLQQGGNILEVWNDHSAGSYLNYAEILLPVDLSVSAGYQVAVSGYAPGNHSLRIGPVYDGSHIFNISDPFQPIELTEWNLDGTEAQMSLTIQGSITTFMAVNSSHYLSVQSIESAQPGRILGASSPADVIITVPESMIEGLTILESLYAARGLSVFIATYREVYDEFGQGVSDPGAVRSLVRWALDTWPDPPQSLLLIGDGSNDPLGFSTGHYSVAPVSVTVGSDSCKDSYFTTVHFGSEVPEIPVSRIPASTVNELLIASEKAVSLGDESTYGPWANTIMLVADDEWGPNESFGENQATNTCELLADTVIPPSVNIVKLYGIEYPWPLGTTGEGAHPTKPEASSDFIEQLNRGVVCASFFGHGSYDQMTHEKLFASSMLGQLTNAPRYFLYNSFSCHNGFFDLAAVDCLAELFLFHPQGGSFASIACTRSSFFSPNETFSIELMDRLHQGEFTIAEALWLSQITVGNKRNYLYPLLGDGGITLPQVETAGCYAEPEDTLKRGQVNAVNVSFPEENSFLFRCRESADTVVYVSPLIGNCTIGYLRYGAELYSSIFSTNQQGEASVNFFVPLQADTGSLARTDATGRIGDHLGTGYSWPTPLIDTGSHSDDSQGPEIELSFPDSQGGEIPSVYQNAVLHVVLSDPSGICVIGGDAGSIIIGSVDGGYDDLTDLFTYDQGSYTTGSLEYPIPELLPGIHEIRVVARDGMKNTGESVLVFNVLHGDSPLLENVGVYPNPVRGQRAFFFTTSSPGSVAVTVYTVAGRPVWQGDTIVQSGSGQFVWNGMDSDGDPLAAGAYIFVVKFSGSSGSSGSSSSTDILVVSP